MRRDIFNVWLEILTLVVVLGAHIQSRLAECIAINIFGLDGWHVSSIAWNFRDALLLFDSLELVVDFLGNVT